MCITTGKVCLTSCHNPECPIRVFPAASGHVQIESSLFRVFHILLVPHEDLLFPLSIL